MFDPKKHDRRSMRLKGYDYSLPGMYFVTICVQGRVCVLGNISGELIELSKIGQIAFEFWQQVPDHFPGVSIDCFVIMPNHMHAIIHIHELPQSKHLRYTTFPKRPTLSQIIAFYKYQTTKQINQTRNSPGERVWQRRFYDHIVRDENELDAIRQYIVNNHFKWEEDQDNPENWESK